MNQKKVEEMRPGFESKLESKELLLQHWYLSAYWTQRRQVETKRDV